jgi:YVTN family beta-propeller protein
VSHVVSAIGLVIRRYATWPAVLLSSACGGAGTEPEPVGPPAGIAVSGGNQQTGQPGGLLTAPVAAKVTDASGRGVPNIPVDFTIIAGEGAIVTPFVRTNGAGIATTRWRLGTIAGSEQRVVATLVDTLTGALVDTAQFTASVAAGPPVVIQVLSGSGQLAGLGQTLAAPLRAIVSDAHGNPTPGVMVSWGVIAGAATVSVAQTPTDAQGIASTTLTTGQTEGDITVRAGIVGLQPAVFVATARRTSTRLTTLAGPAFGIARTPSGQLLVSLIYSGQVQRLSIATPGSTALASVQGTPVVLATDAAGQYAYVANMSGRVDIVEISSATRVATVAIPGEAHSLAMSPRGDRVYVTNTDNSVFAVDVVTRTIVGTTVVGSGPWGIAFWTSGSDSLMYVSARNGGAIFEIDMRTGNVLRTLAVSGRPHGVAMTPNGTTLFVADDSNGEILVINRATGSTAQRLSASGAFGMAVSPDGNTVYVTTNDGYIVVVDVPSTTITKRYWAGGEPRQIVVSPDGNTAMAANLGGWIDVVTR